MYTDVHTARKLQEMLTLASKSHILTQLAEMIINRFSSVLVMFFTNIGHFLRVSVSKQITNDIPLISIKWVKAGLQQPEWSQPSGTLFTVKCLRLNVCKLTCWVCVFYFAVSTCWSKLMRQVSEQCLFALPAAIPDTCFQQEKQWKYFIRCQSEFVSFATQTFVH